MDYQESITYLEKEVGFASVPGLTRVLSLLERMGNPQKNLTCIHIAGTNGKGSASAMLSSVLNVSGYRTAVYTSPHLQSYTERYVIADTPIAKEDFAKEITYAKELCLAMEKDGEDVPTLFEILTAVAFHYFAAQNVDIAIMEVGLGGRFDATNVIDTPLLSLIMSISIDHTDFLGNSLADIAKEKSGIIKKNCPVVLYPQEETVYNIVRETAEGLSAPLYYMQNIEYTVLSRTLKETVFSVQGTDFSNEEIHLPLLGDYQIQNCITVLYACTLLQKSGLSLTKESIAKGIAHAHWAGRMEICGESPLVLLDGAHNADGIKKLAATLPAYTKGRNITLILGVLGDKEYDSMLSEIFPLIRQAVLTEPESLRKLDACVLKKQAEIYGKPLYVEKELTDAYEKACSLTKPADVILCCGSLYMIGAMRSIILNKK